MAHVQLEMNVPHAFTHLHQLAAAHQLEEARNADDGDLIGLAGAVYKTDGVGRPAWNRGFD
jgi:hypothetical protein